VSLHFRKDQEFFVKQKNLKPISGEICLCYVIKHKLTKLTKLTDFFVKQNSGGFYG